MSAEEPEGSKPTFADWVSPQWLIGLILATNGFVLALVALALPWTAVVLERPVDGVTYPTFVSRASNYGTLPLLATVLLMLFGGLAGLVFASRTIVSVLTGLLLPVSGIVCACAVLLVCLHGDIQIAGDPSEAARHVAPAAALPEMGLGLFAVGMVMLTSGPGFAAIDQLARKAERAGWVDRRQKRGVRPAATATAAVGTVLALLSFFRPWFEVDGTVTGLTTARANTTIAALDQWAQTFRAAIVGCLVLILVVQYVGSHLRRRMAVFGFWLSLAALGMLTALRLVAWSPEGTAAATGSLLLAFGSGVFLIAAFALSYLSADRKGKA